jgi:hypothetical protein
MVPILLGDVGRRRPQFSFGDVGRRRRLQALSGSFGMSYPNRASGSCASWGLTSAATVITLLDEHEFKMLQVATLGKSAGGI